MAVVDASRASAEAGGGRRVAAGAGHALLVLLARGGGRLARASGLGRAFGRIGEARGGRWPRESSSAAASVFGEVGNGERGSREE